MVCRLPTATQALRASVPLLVVHDAHPGIVWTPMLRRQLGPLAKLLRWCGLSQRLFKTPRRGAAMVLAASLGEPHHPAQGEPAYFVEGELNLRHVGLFLRR